ncbi:MAG: SusD/RagB family nutrient-binding outer membrane lipoprotein [Gemmatimonadales bacterium]|nr:MAG: SusD/RagB family nutrient-binding outer membrane lipoprotein [Gemmatimonadales bacterium]
MKTSLIAKRALLAGLVLAVGACGDLTTINENPNAPTDVGADFLLPQSIRSGVEATFGAGQMLSHTAIWPQHAVELQYPDEEVGDVRAARMTAYWTNYYSNSLADIQVVIDKGIESGDGAVEGIGLIWKTWLFHIVTDLWGEVPYSQALLGAENTAPAYDAQEDIYSGMIQALTDATAKLATGSGFSSGDILYGNDLAAWRKFANSLRMRLAMRLSEVDPSAAQAAFAAAYAAGGFTSNADNAMLAWPGAPYENPLFENWQGRDDHGVSETMIDTLVSMADPRLELYAEPATHDGAYRGLQNGRSDAEFSLSYYSRIGDHWRADGASTPTAIMTYSEVALLAAEAANRGWIADDAATLYEAGIRANMAQWSGANSPTQAEIDAYVPTVAYAGDDATGLAQIQLQQWIGLFMNGSEAWSHWRRTGVPDLAMGPDLALSRIPVRFTYPDIEQSLNQASWEAANQRQGADALTTTVWWQTN